VRHCVVGRGGGFFVEFSEIELNGCTVSGNTAGNATIDPNKGTGKLLLYRLPHMKMA